MMFFTKTAVLLEWIRIFVADRQRNTFFYAACSLIAVNASVYAAGAVATGLACIPREKLWHPWIQGKCIDRYVLDTFTAFINLAIDLWIFFLPQKIIWKLQMSKKRKIGMSVLFSVGLMWVKPPQVNELRHIRAIRTNERIIQSLRVCRRSSILYGHLRLWGWCYIWSVTHFFVRIRWDDDGAYGVLHPVNTKGF